MGHQRVAAARVAVIVLTGVFFASLPVSGQTRAASAGRTTAPRTAWGAPDLQGVWSSGTVTPLERPANVTKEFLTETEIADVEQRARAAATDEARGQTAAQDVTGAYNDFWWDRGTRVGGRRTSLIVDPPTGRMPPLTPAMQKFADSPEAKRIQETRRGMYPAASWTDTDLWDRCITRGLPIVPGPYNNNFQIFQTPTHVAILHEMIHDVRIVPLDNRPHLSSVVRQWFGDAVGRWEGETLVVETKNFSPKQELPFEPRTSAGGMHLVERFTRLDNGTLNYEFTVNDPSTYSRPWTAVLPLVKSDGAVFEYACHEGNYGLTGILSGSRAKEKEAGRTSSR
jgi:hypothetical protein